MKTNGVFLAKKYGETKKNKVFSKEFVTFLQTCGKHLQKQKNNRFL